MMELYTNDVKLKGYIGKNAESFATKNQTTLVRFSLAVKSGYKDKQTQQWVDRTEWPRIVAFGKPADYAKRLLKGDYVEIVGELHSTEREVEIFKDKKKSKIKIRDWEVRASIVKKLAKPVSGQNPDAGVPADRSSSVGWDAEPITEDDAA